MENDPKLSAKSAAGIYAVSQQKLSCRRLGMPARHDIPANLMKLTDTEESAIVERILTLSGKGFPPRLFTVGDMANRLLPLRDATPVGPRWANSFVGQQPELRTCFTRNMTFREHNAKIRL